MRLNARQRASSLYYPSFGFVHFPKICAHVHYIHADGIAFQCLSLFLVVLHYYFCYCWHSGLLKFARPHVDIHVLANLNVLLENILKRVFCLPAVDFLCQNVTI